MGRCYSESIAPTGVARGAALVQAGMYANFVPKPCSRVVLHWMSFDLSSMNEENSVAIGAYVCCWLIPCKTQVQPDRMRGRDVQDLDIGPGFGDSWTEVE